MNRDNLNIQLPIYHLQIAINPSQIHTMYELFCCSNIFVLNFARRNGSLHNTSPDYCHYHILHIKQMELYDINGKGSIFNYIHHHRNCMFVSSYVRIRHLKDFPHFSESASTVTVPRNGTQYP